MFTCRDGEGGKLSSQASKMLYKPPGAVYIASYKERLDQSDFWKLFVHVFYMCITLFLAAKILFPMFLSEIFFPFNKLNLDLVVSLA